jgi:glutamyl-tRNA synthetase
VGVARSALFSWLYARQNDGIFVLRVEDTDQTRATDEAYAGIQRDLEWLGLTWDEGPGVGGPNGPYRQSERLERYARAATALIEGGHAYRCYCTAEELDERRKIAQKEKRPPGYDGRCRNLSPEERAAFEAEGRSFAVRFAVPEGRDVSFTDMVRGDVTVSTTQIPDFVIQRSDGWPTYMLAVTVDDYEMEITHIVRGEDLLPATPRQLLMREAMGIEEIPGFAHLPLLVAPDGRPLSKRWGDVAVSAYREQGFLPEAMVNYLALLGWSFDDKTNIFSINDLIERFSLERVGKNPASFDVTKLEWINQHYIKEKSPEGLAEALVTFCVAAGIEGAASPDGRTLLAEVAPLINERIKRLEEAPSMVRFLFERVTPDEKAAKVLADQGEYLAAVKASLEQIETWTTEAIEATLRALADEQGLKPKQAFQPIRAAVMGTLVSPPLFESLEILGRTETLERLST